MLEGFERMEGMVSPETTVVWSNVEQWSAIPGSLKLIGRLCVFMCADHGLLHRACLSFQHKLS